MAQYEDIIIDQGADQTIKLELVDTSGATKDLTGYSASAQIRKTYNSSDSDAVTFSSQIQSPADEGIVNLTLTNAQTSAMKSGRYVYDVEISFVDSAANTIVERILEGQVTVSPSVTRT
jgi:hypothetical protein